MFMSIIQKETNQFQLYRRNGNYTNDRNKSGNGHHKGLFNKILLNSKLHRTENPKIEYFKFFLNDEYHGVVHGLFTGFIVYLLYKEKNIWINAEEHDIVEQFTTSLLHDFCKIENGHDKYLKNVIPNLLPETYSHSNPLSSDENKFLIIADRFELMRFPDWKKWVDNKKLENTTISPKLIQKINFFYKNIRPLFVNCIKLENKPIISHVLETSVFLNRTDNSELIYSILDQYDNTYYPHVGMINSISNNKLTFYDEKIMQ